MEKKELASLIGNKAAAYLTGKNKLAEVAKGENELAEVAEGENELAEVAEGKNKLAEVTKGENKLVSRRKNWLAGRKSKEQGRLGQLRRRPCCMDGGLILFKKEFCTDWHSFGKR